MVVPRAGSGETTPGTLGGLVFSFPGDANPRRGLPSMRGADWHIAGARAGFCGAVPARSYTDGIEQVFWDCRIPESFAVPCLKTAVR
jgi:hypothetical protein